MYNLKLNSSKQTYKIINIHKTDNNKKKTYFGKWYSRIFTIVAQTARKRSGLISPTRWQRKNRRRTTISRFGFGALVTHNRFKSKVGKLMMWIDMYVGRGIFAHHSIFFFQNAFLSAFFLTRPLLASFTSYFNLFCKYNSELYNLRLRRICSSIDRKISLLNVAKFSVNFCQIGNTYTHKKTITVNRDVKIKGIEAI